MWAKVYGRYHIQRNADPDSPPLKIFGVKICHHFFHFWLRKA